MFISVAVPTCDRPADLERCLASLAQLAYREWKLIVVDQSDGDQSRQVVEAWRPRLPEVTYLRLAEKNASAARNLGIANATGEVLAFLDDDCSVSPDWLDRVREVFDQEPDASLVFGAVKAAEHDPAAAIVPTYEPNRLKRLQGRLAGWRMGGIGASMYLRLGSRGTPRFDLSLGPGARFRITQDWDFRYRVLAAGALVIETPRINVVHHGARSYAGGMASLKVRDYLYGIGAAHSKLLRCGEWIMFLAIPFKLGESIAAIRPQNALRNQPTRVGGLLMYLRGLKDGFKVPVERQARLYRDPA